MASDWSNQDIQLVTIQDETAPPTHDRSSTGDGDLLAERKDGKSRRVIFEERINISYGDNAQLGENDIDDPNVREISDLFGNQYVAKVRQAHDPWSNSSTDNSLGALSSLFELAQTDQNGAEREAEDPWCLETKRELEDFIANCAPRLYITSMKADEMWMSLHKEQEARTSCRSDVWRIDGGPPSCWTLGRPFFTLADKLRLIQWVSEHYLKIVTFDTSVLRSAPHSELFWIPITEKMNIRRIQDLRTLVTIAEIKDAFFNFMNK